MGEDDGGKAVILSILTPAIPARLGQLDDLCAKLTEQIGVQPVEHLCLLDNRKRTVGAKRDALLRAARGKYVAFLDDDDDVADNYVAALLAAAASDPDVITFGQSSTVNGETGLIDFHLGNPNEPFAPGGVTRRNAWHVCAWRRSLAMLSSFPESNYGEDWTFAAKLCALPGLREEHVSEVLHFYRHNAATTAAPAP